MANIKSAKKRILVERRNAERNKAIRSKVKTAIKMVDAAIAANDKAASKGVYHQKNASRKISRLTIAVNKIA